MKFHRSDPSSIKTNDTCTTVRAPDGEEMFCGNCLLAANVVFMQQANKVHTRTSCTLVVCSKDAGEREHSLSFLSFNLLDVVTFLIL
mmetsp:Transcript_26682/g.43894  ORF Transcript_26682/g.43894 Transcript_26682/m.43894 type:complete len:87 (-) Transcript_26682:22-282(-)